MLTANLRALTVAVFGAVVLSCSGEPLAPTPPDNTVRRVEVAPVGPVQLAGGATSQLSATAFNGAGTPVSGQSFTWVSSVPTVASVNTSGLVTAALIGSTNITASVSGVSSASAAITVVEGTPATLFINTQPSGAAAGASFGVQPAIEVRDAGGNLTSAATAVTADIASGGGTLSGSTTVSASGGVATFTTLGIAGTTGSRTLSFSSTGLATVTSAPFAVTAGAPANYTVSLSSTAPVAGAAVTVTAQVVDANGNNVATAGRVVTWSTTGAGGSFATPTSTTDASGQVSVQYTTPKTVGSGTVTARDASTLTGTSAAITSVAGPAAKYTVTPSTTSPVAGAAVTITAQLADANGNAVSTAGTVVTWSATGAAGTFATPTSTTGATGVATVSYTTAVLVSPYTVTATDGGGLTGTSATFTSVAGPASAARSTVQPSVTVLAADGLSTVMITVQLRDANTNVVHVSGGIVVISATTSTVSTTTDNHDGTYTATLTAPNAPSSATVNATLNGVALPGTAITFVPNTATRYVVTSNTVQPVAGTAATISAQLANVSGGAVRLAGRVVTWTKTGSGGTFASAQSTTDANGLATVSLTTGTAIGVYQITATDNASVSGSLSLTTVPGAPARYVVGTTTSTPVAGASVSVTAQLVDANGNFVSLLGRTITWSVGSAAGGGVFTPATSQTSASGVASTSYATGTSIGVTYAVTALDANSITGSANVTNAVGTPTSVTWTLGDVVVSDTAYATAGLFTAVNQYGRSMSSPALTYVSREASAASVSSAGVVTPIARGQTMLVATSTANVAAKDSVLFAIATAGGPVLRTDLSRFDIKHDTTFTLTVIADMRSATRLGAATVEVTWDPLQLIYVSDAEGTSSVGATVGTANAANGSLLITAASSSGFAGTVQLRRITFRAASTTGRAGFLTLLATELTAATTFTSVLGTTLAISHPVVIR